jgi:hypothetical protein
VVAPLLFASNIPLDFSPNALVDQEEVQPISLPDFKLNNLLTSKGSPLPQQVPQLEDSVVDQSPAVLKIKTACEATPISARSDLMNKQLKKSLMEMQILTAKLDAGQSSGSWSKDFVLTPERPRFNHGNQKCQKG